MKIMVTNSYRCSYKFAFILFLSFLTNEKQESGFQQVGGLVKRNISAFCLQRVALYFKAMLNSIDFHKGIFLHGIPVCIIVSCFDIVWHAGLLHKLKSYGISGQIFGLISSFLSNRWLQVVLDGNSSQEYPVNAGVCQRSIVGPTLFLLYISDLPDDVICNMGSYADDTNLYSKCDQSSDLWQELELASEL